MRENAKTQKRTRASPVLPAKVNTIDPAASYGLDRRIIAMGLRQWTGNALVLQDAGFTRWNENTKNLETCTYPVHCPTLVLQLDSAWKWPALPLAHKVLEDVGPSTYFTIPTEKAVHLRIDAPVEKIATTMQFMKIINEVDSDTSTSSWMRNGGP